MMQIITVNLPAVYVDAIKKLTDQGLYPSRSEAIRVALRAFLGKELKMVEHLLEIVEAARVPVTIRDQEIKKRGIDMRSIRRGWEKNYPKID